MDRDIAEKLIVEARRIVGSFNALSGITMEIGDESVRHSIRQALAQMMTTLDSQVLRPVASEFPDLDIQG